MSPLQLGDIATSPNAAKTATKQESTNFQVQLTWTSYFSYWSCKLPGCFPLSFLLMRDDALLLMSSQKGSEHSSDDHDLRQHCGTARFHKAENPPSAYFTTSQCLPRMLVTD